MFRLEEISGAHPVQPLSQSQTKIQSELRLLRYLSSWI